MDAEKKNAVKDDIKITQASADKQVLIKKGMGIDEIVRYDEAGKFLVFDIIHFPELSMTQLGKLSSKSQMAYQMDLRAAGRVDSIIDDGSKPFSERLQVISDRDPLARRSEDARKGMARKVPKGKKHLNVGAHEVNELERVGWKKAKSEEVDIVGSQNKEGAVVLTDQKGNVENVTMLVDKEDYEAHREADRDRSRARLDTNLEATKENMRRFMPKVTIYDKSDLIQRK